MKGSDIGMASKIIRTYNGTIIVPYYPKQMKQLEYETSTYDRVYHKSIEITGFKMNYAGLPAFITHNQSEEYLKGSLPTYEITTMDVIKPKNVMYDFSLNSDINPTDIQSDIINQIELDFRKSGRDAQKEWFVNLQTGFGKTLLSVYLVSVIKYKTLIMCFSTEILDQWAKTIHDKTNFDCDRLLLINNSKILLNILEGKFNTDDFDIIMCTPGLIMSFAKKYGLESLEPLFTKMGIGLKIFDEAHRNKANIVKINALTNVKYTLYLSADFGQSDRDIEIMYYKIFKHCKILRADEDSMFDMRYTKAIIVEYNTEPTLIESESIKNKYGFSPQYYMTYQFNKGMIIDVIYYLIDKIDSINDKHHRILILFKNIDHVDTMLEKCQERYGDNHIIGRYHGNVSTEEKECTLQCADIIISTYQSFGTGIDVSNIKYVISTNQCNKIEDNQAAGRARPMKDGSDVFYFMLIDKGFKYCTTKLKTRLSYLNQTKIKQIVKIKYESSGGTTSNV